MALKRLQRFQLAEFVNPRSGSKSYRVAGTRADGERVRRNFNDRDRARLYLAEEEQAFLGAVPDERPQITRLSSEQIGLAEAVFLKLETPKDILHAVDHWLAHGRVHAQGQEVRLDQAAAEFVAWLDQTPTLRERSKRGTRYRVGIFVSETGNIPVQAITPDLIDDYLGRRKISPLSRRNDLSTISIFCDWMTGRPRRWLAYNPAKSVKVELPRPGEPEVYSWRESLRLLAAARRHEDGRWLGYVVLGLFCALRPTEAVRVRLTRANLADGEIRLRAEDTKTHRARTVSLHPVAQAWLRLCIDRPIPDPQKFPASFRALRRKARVRWITDGLRHSGISYLFRRIGSYGLAAEQAGNSERIIKAHYQGRVSAEDAAKFWRLFPSRAQRRAAL